MRRDLGPLLVLAFAGLSCAEFRRDEEILSGNGADMSASGFDVDLGLNECGAVEYDGQQGPAAMLAVLDRSSSMAEGGKWTYAAQAIVGTLDRDVFNGMSLGLYAAPSGSVTGPACIFNFPVSCRAPVLPQIGLTPAMTSKSSDGTGVRRRIADWMQANSPDDGIGDASPLYEALRSAIISLQAFGGVGKRMMFVVTDGTISCGQLAVPARPGFPDANGCDRDWEDPKNIVTLLETANRDAQKPIETFIVGVPGADTYDPMGRDYPPYRMRNALSAMAYAGAPQHVPLNCTGRSFTKAGADPAVSCHFDLTQGNFSSQAVSDAIARARGTVLGCTYEVPTGNGGAMVDKAKVNVRYTKDGKRVDLFKRMDQANLCTQTGCWDYTQDGKIQLYGKACDEVTGSGDVKVRISVGCATVLR